MQDIEQTFQFYRRRPPDGFDALRSTRHGTAPPSDGAARDWEWTMPRWRSAAIERLPELRETIAKSESVMALWIELLLAFEDAYREPQNDNLIARIYSYADWCFAAPRRDDAGHDPLTAVAVAFYEHIPDFKPARDDMPRWFTYAEVAENRSTFGYHLDVEAFEDLLQHMKKNSHRYVPRPRPGR